MNQKPASGETAALPCGRGGRFTKPLFSDLPPKTVNMAFIQMLKETRQDPNAIPAIQKTFLAVNSSFKRNRDKSKVHI
jgi:hypothetical protein